MKEILITSSVLIAALLLLRLVFAKKVSRRILYGAWLLVALRLLIPVQIGQLDFSVLTAAKDVTHTIEQVATQPIAGPSRQEVYKDIVLDYLEKDQTVFSPEVQEQIREETAQGTATKEEIADKIQQNYAQQEIFVPEVQQQIQQQVAETVTAPTLGQIATAIWLTGAAVMAVWFAVVNLRHSRSLQKEAQLLECDSPIPVYVSAQAESPCLMGLVRPVIYLTTHCAGNDSMRRHVLTHELTHYRHGDHVWALVRCLCLCLYWFHPLVWVAAFVSRRDCELACDEGALKHLGEDERIAYGKTLVAVVSHATTPSDLLQTATAMAETKRQLKERVSFIVKKPRISLIAVICMVLICVIIAGCVAAGPTSTQRTLENDPPAATPTTSPSTTGSTQPTDPKPTDPKPTDPQPTEPIEDELAKFNALFGNLDSWYNKALTSEYTTPAQLDLMLFFLAEFREESNQVTDSERAQLKDLYGYSDYIDMLDITCLPVDKMNQVLQDYFGITLDEVDAAGFEELDYLESTNCYYIIGGGASGVMDFNALAVETLEDGSIRVTYKQFTGSDDEIYVVTLMPYGDGYRILSNTAQPDSSDDPNR